MGMVLPWALVAVLVACATASDAASDANVGHDDSCLMQKSLKVEKEGQDLSATGSCECLNWKNAYTGGRADAQSKGPGREIDVECGRGLEFSVVHHDKYEATAKEFIDTMSNSLQEVKPFVDREFCQNSYTRMDDNQCMRTSMEREAGKWYSQYWCYVSDECAAEQGANENLIKVPLSKVHVKMCEKGKDKLLGDMNPAELMAYGQRHGMSVPGFLVKVAYPSERKWFFKDAEAHKAELQEIQDSGVTTVIDVIDEHQDKLLVKGKKMWIQPNSYTGFRCVSPSDVYPYAVEGGCE